MEKSRGIEKNKLTLHEEEVLYEVRSKNSKWKTDDKKTNRIRDILSNINWSEDQHQQWEAQQKKLFKWRTN